MVTEKTCRLQSPYLHRFYFPLPGLLALAVAVISLVVVQPRFRGGTGGSCLALPHPDLGQRGAKLPKIAQPSRSCRGRNRARRPFRVFVCQQ